TGGRTQKPRFFPGNAPLRANSLFGAQGGWRPTKRLISRLFSTARHFELWRAAWAQINHSPLYPSPRTNRMLPLMSEVTRVLSAIEQGDPHAAEALLPLVYDELRKLAAHKLAREKPGQTLQATALVHEAYLRLVDVDKAQHWNSRGHFFAAAAEAM